MTARDATKVGYHPSVRDVRHRLRPPLRTMREIRVSADIGLRDLQERTGLDKSVLSQIERGRLSPTPHETAAISQALGVTLELRLQLVHEERSST